jgi:lipoprotein-anchoring transpeptidase ErfK/SrfK
MQNLAERRTRQQWPLFRRYCRINRSDVHVPRRTAAAAGTAAAGIAAAALVAGCGHGGATPAHADSPAAAAPVSPRQVSAEQLAGLPSATTFTRLRGAPADPDPATLTSGLVVHPRTTQVVYATPGGPPVAALPSTELGSPTWVPVVQDRPGWDQVLLPARPNHATGWISTGGGALQSAQTPYVIRVDLAAERVTVFDHGQKSGSWTVAVGAPATPTPTGRTFLMASLQPAHPTYSPLILPLGAHSDTLDTFGGGPGTVALHGWPDTSVFGQAVTHGCVRVPSAALDVLSQIPLGSLVLIHS